MAQARTPVRIIKSVAPIRICDNGGWTDTWFAGHGAIFNIAVYPYAEVQIFLYRRKQGEKRITIHAENYGERYRIGTPKGHYDKHPLIEAAIEYMRIPENISFEVSIFSEAPVGCSTGTSAAVSVALIGALDRLTPGQMTAHEIALAAQKIETEMLKQQCGIQDQIASAYGGINYIDMYQYPYASVSPIHVPNSTWWELESRLVLIYLGTSHNSSEVHRKVIKELEAAGPDAKKLEPLRKTAGKSRDALYAGDFKALGRAMIENTEAQMNLHPDLAGPHHRKVIDMAKACGALGWKVNGAGGDGGSVTILCDTDHAKRRALIKAIEQSNRLYKSIPIYLSRQGLRVW